MPVPARFESVAVCPAVGSVTVVIGRAAVPTAWPIMLSVPPARVSVVVYVVVVLAPLTRMSALMLAVPPLTVKFALVGVAEVVAALPRKNWLVTFITPVAVALGAAPPMV